MEEKIAEGLETAFDSVLKAKNEYYAAHPQEIPSRREIDALIRTSMAKNATISGGASLIPGPWGMLAVVPELMLVIRNQIGLIYDIGAAYGHRETISKELLLGVFVSAAGAGAGSLLAIHGSQVLVRRASLRVMQKIIALLGGRITQQALKSAVSKWLPGVGAAAMAAWTGYLTKQIGEKARDVMQREIVIDAAANEADTATEAPAAADPHIDEGTLLEFYKLQVLVELAKIDGKVTPEEAQFVETALQSPELTDEQREKLRLALTGEALPLQGVEALAARPDSAIALLSNMIALARKDEEVHITEKLYIKKIGGMLGFSASDVDEVMASM